MSTIPGVSALPTNGTQPERLRKVAEQMEAVFMRTLLAEVRQHDLVDEEGPFAVSNAQSQFQELLHAELADTSAGGLGIADMVVRQLSVQTAITKAEHPLTGKVPHDD